MNIAALLALLLNSGACAKTDFQSPDGSMLSVVVCPVVQPFGGTQEPPPPPPPPAPAPPQRET